MDPPSTNIILKKRKRMEKRERMKKNKNPENEIKCFFCEEKYEGFYMKDYLRIHYLKDHAVEALHFKKMGGILPGFLD